jgi:hypothetical protein
MKTAYLTLVLVAAGLFAPAQAENRRSTDSLAVDAAGTGSAEIQCQPGSVAGSEGCVPEGNQTGRSDPFKGTNVAKIKQDREAKEKAAQGKSAPPRDAAVEEDAGIDPATTGKAAEPQIYKATTGKTGKTK